MKSRLMLLAAYALIAAACGGSTAVGEGEPRTTAPLTTTVAPTTSTSVAVAPTTAPPKVITGGGGVAATPSPELSLLRSAFGKVEARPPATIEGVIQIKGVAADVGAIDISIPISSSVDSVTGDGHLSIDFSQVFEQLEEDLPPDMAQMMQGFEVRQVGDTAYLRFGFFNAMFGVETDWISMPAEDGSGFTQDFASGVNPYDATALITLLEKAGAEVTVLGEDTIRETAVTHYRAVFDLESLEQLDPVAFAELRETAPVGELELPMDLWIDDLGQIHRFLFEIESPDLGDLQPGESFDLMRVQFDFSDYGERVTVEPPDPGDVTDINELEHMFGSMFEEFEV